MHDIKAQNSTISLTTLMQSLGNHSVPLKLSKGALDLFKRQPTGVIPLLPRTGRSCRANFCIYDLILMETPSVLFNLFLFLQWSNLSFLPFMHEALGCLPVAERTGYWSLADSSFGLGWGQSSECEHGRQTAVYWQRAELITPPFPFPFLSFVSNFSVARTHTSDESLSSYTPIPWEAGGGSVNQTLLLLFFLYKVELLHASLSSLWSSLSTWPLVGERSNQTADS